MKFKSHRKTVTLQSVFNLLIFTVMTTTINLPELPYALNALEPNISEETMSFHYGKHHQAYVTNLNKLIANSKFENMPLEEIIRNSDGAIFNNAAQIYNHSFYFLALTPNAGSAPSVDFAKAIDRDFGSIENLKKEMNAAAMGQFGSGWAWLVVDKDDKLAIVKSSNAETPITDNLKPILCLDVWEHAYYIDYRNKRAEYLDKIWNVVDWNKLSERWGNR